MICLATMTITNLTRQSNRCSDRTRIDPKWSQTTPASRRCRRDIVAEVDTTIHLSMLLFLPVIGPAWLKVTRPLVITYRVGTYFQSACHAPTIWPTNNITCVLDEVIKPLIICWTIYEFNLAWTRCHARGRNRACSSQVFQHVEQDVRVLTSWLFWMKLVILRVTWFFNIDTSYVYIRYDIL